MRILVTAIIPTTVGNEWVRKPEYITTIEDYIKKFNCEASYFIELNGKRTMIFVLDLPTSDLVPKISEPLFQGFQADVQIHVAMNLDDLKKAIPKVQQNHLEIPMT